MGVATGFTNSFTSGELADDAWDRVDIQPLAKGCAEASNLVIRISGPLGKRRGFWDLGSVNDAGSRSRLIPFRRSVDDALMLEFSDAVVRVFQSNGAPLMDGGSQVSFASPYIIQQLDGLRYKQVADTIYFRHSAGLVPQTLVRRSNTDWTWTVETFKSGPWRPENTDTSKTLLMDATCELDANTQTQGGTIMVGTPILLTANFDLFDPGHVGSYWRLRQNDGSPSVKSWAAGYKSPVGYYCVSNGRVYNCLTQAATTDVVTNPPVVSFGQQSDGGNLWEYRHDGAGVVQITSVTDARHAGGVVVKAVPIPNALSTSCFAESAFSDYRGWPRMWPTVREERIAEGATATDLDYLDLTETAGFDTVSESFSPGLGTGTVVDTDAIRRRLGDDGSELIWAHVVTYLIVGSSSAEYLVAGSVLDEPLSPAAVTVKTLSGYGSADVYPAKAHKGLLYVTRGGQTLREISIDTAQGYTTDDMTVLVKHIARRGFAQLAWVSQPDETLWARMADGGLAVMTYHQEQQVRGWTTQALPPGWTCEDIAVLPGPGKLDTLWAVVSRSKGAESQRRIWMLSSETDALFIDGAGLYEGLVGATTFAGLDHYEGETVRIWADGSQFPDQVVTGGQVTLPKTSYNVRIGMPLLARFKSLRLNTEPAATGLNSRQRVTAATVSLKTAGARVGLDGTAAMEGVAGRERSDVPAAQARRVIKNVTIAGDTTRDPHLIVEDDTAFDCVIYSLKPKVAG